MHCILLYHCAYMVIRAPPNWPRLTRRVPYSNHSVLLSVLLSVCPSKNFNIGHNFFTFKDKSFIFGMCDSYDKTFPTVP